MWLCLCLGWLAPAEVRAATPPPLRAAHAAVASDNPLASAAGLSMLRAGGNAIDAACATALALGVVHPFASGMGGGGFAVVYIAKEKKVYALDFRERAPAAIRPELYKRDGRVDPTLSAVGGLAVAVPGEVRGLGELVRRWGALPFRKCVEPAQRLAARGFSVSWRLAESFGSLADEKKAPPTGAAPAGAPTATPEVSKPDATFDCDLRPQAVHRRRDLAASRSRLDARPAARRRRRRVLQGRHRRRDRQGGAGQRRRPRRR